MIKLRPQQHNSAAAMAEELAETLITPPSVQHGNDFSPSSPRWRDQSLSKGAAGIAILHGVRARYGIADAKPVHEWLVRATRDGLTAGPGAGLWFGVPALAFALQAAAPRNYRSAFARLDSGVTQLVLARLEIACARIDTGQRPSQYEFDLTRGLSGLGAYLLKRAPDGDLIRQILSYLVRLTEPVKADDEAGLKAPGWWVCDKLGKEHGPSSAIGEANFGMAHGISGPLALLALAMRQGIVVDGQAAAIERICRWIDDWRQDAPEGPWWPERITINELRDGRTSQNGPLRPSWCYGTPGLARAQQLAGLALRDATRQEAAENAFVRCLTDPLQLAQVVDPALCHGWAGLFVTAWHAAADAVTPTLAAHLPNLLDVLLAHARDSPTEALPGLIEGRAGVALALHTVSTGTSDRWPGCLLLN